MERNAIGLPELIKDVLCAPLKATKSMAAIAHVESIQKLTPTIEG